MLIYLRAIPRSLLISNVSLLHTDPTIAFLALFLFIKLKKLFLVKANLARSNTSLMEFSLLSLILQTYSYCLFEGVIYLVGSRILSSMLFCLTWSRTDRFLEDNISIFHYSVKVCSNKKNICFLLLCMFLFSWRNIWFSFPAVLSQKYYQIPLRKHRVSNEVTIAKVFISNTFSNIQVCPKVGFSFRL